jgi:hypothetical protein
MPGPNRVNHIGIVAKDASKKAAVGGLYTIEGNTGGTNPRNGGMVASVFRSAATCKAYVKYFVALPYVEPKDKAKVTTVTPTVNPAMTKKVTPDVKPKPKTYKVTITAKSGLIVRKSATTKSDRVKALKHGTVVTVTNEKRAESVNGNMLWLKVSGGWIAAEYTKRV